MSNILTTLAELEAKCNGALLEKCEGEDSLTLYACELRRHAKALIAVARAAQDAVEAGAVDEIYLSRLRDHLATLKEPAS